MPREKELFEPTLESIRIRAKELYPNKLLFTRPEASKIMGTSISTLYRHGLGSNITAEQLARTFA
jgi:chromosome condensin MukBEF ATPase and DNA-binding subunit MukB